MAVRTDSAPALTRAQGALMIGGTSVLALVFLLGARPPRAFARHLPPVPSVAALPAAPAPPAQTASPPPFPRITEGPLRFLETLDVSNFQKGNIHTHSTWSDGDRPPQDVYLWYREHGYNFLALTDHNTLTDPAIFRLLERKKFIMITGEEVTLWGAGKQVHVNALCTKTTIGGRRFETQREALSWAVGKVKEQGGVALVNHPNWDWSLTAADLPAARGAALLEIWSGHPYVHTLGDETRPSHEALWDKMLTAGEGFAGAAIDDAHAYGAHAPENHARPGRAWVYAFTPDLNKKAICAALAEGKLYGSTGVTLKRIVVTEDSYAVYPSDRAVEVEFVGLGGAVLQRGKAGEDGAARYQLRGGEGYVRARLTNAQGKHAWTQAAHVAG